MQEYFFVEAAETNIYINGLPNGKVIDRTKPSGKNDGIFIAKGKPFYWWWVKAGIKGYSISRPRRSDLARKEINKQVYIVEERIQDAIIVDALGLEECKNYFIHNIVDNILTPLNADIENMPISTRIERRKKRNKIALLNTIEAWRDAIKAAETIKKLKTITIEL